MKTVQFLNESEVIKLTQEYLGNEIFNTDDVIKLFREKVVTRYAKFREYDLVLLINEDSINPIELILDSEKNVLYYNRK